MSEKQPKRTSDKAQQLYAFRLLIFVLLTLMALILIIANGAGLGA